MSVSYQRDVSSRRPLTLGVVLLALVGIVNATLIIVKGKASGALVCFGSNSCETVLSSSYAYMFGVPVAWLGVAFYVMIFILGCIVLVRREGMWTKILFGASLVGFLFSLYLFGVQWLILEAFCYYCIVSFFDSSIIFGLMLYILKRFVVR